MAVALGFWLAVVLTSQSHSQEQVAAHRFPPTTLST